VPVPDGPVSPAAAGTVAESFHTAHEQLYGYCFRGDESQQVEWVNLRVTGIGPIQRPSARRIGAAAGGGAARARTGSRPVRFGDWAETPVYDRARLAAGDTLAGPAVIEEFGATIPLHPGFAARVDGSGNLLLTRAGAGHGTPPVAVTP
jgi:N-methylhydantoinase A